MTTRYTIKWAVGTTQYPGYIDVPSNWGTVVGAFKHQTNIGNTVQVSCFVNGLDTWSEGDGGDVSRLGQIFNGVVITVTARSKDGK